MEHLANAVGDRGEVYRAFRVETRYGRRYDVQIIIAGRHAGFREFSSVEAVRAFWPDLRWSVEGMPGAEESGA